MIGVENSKGEIAVQVFCKTFSKMTICGQHQGRIGWIRDIPQFGAQDGCQVLAIVQTAVEANCQPIGTAIRLQFARRLGRNPEVLARQPCGSRNPYLTAVWATMA